MTTAGHACPIACATALVIIVAANDIAPGQSPVQTDNIGRHIAKPGGNFIEYQQQAKRITQLPHLG
jgi:hypothetical protein